MSSGPRLPLRPWAYTPLPPPLPHRCSCLTGFEGPTCGVNTDDCVEHTCANGGICVDGVGNYTCQCPLQYAGTWGVSVCGELKASMHGLSRIPTGSRVGALPQCLLGCLPGGAQGGSFSPASPSFFPQEGPVSS